MAIASIGERETEIGGRATGQSFARARHGAVQVFLGDPSGMRAEPAKSLYGPDVEAVARSLPVPARGQSLPIGGHGIEFVGRSAD